MQVISPDKRSREEAAAARDGHHAGCSGEEERRHLRAMRPQGVFLSVLMFGVAGLLLFMYLQVRIQEQHAGKTGRPGNHSAIATQ